MNSKDLLSLMVINRITNYTPGQKYEIYRRYKDYDRILEERKSIENIFKKPFLSEGRDIGNLDIEEQVKRELEYYEHRKITLIDITGELYPKRLRYIFDPPLLLYAKGNVQLLNKEFTIAVVGARKASNRSISLAYEVGRELAEEDICVVSGLASGIDSFAHRGALMHKGSTIAVLGNGIDVTYPKRNRELYESIGKSGCIITEFPIGTDPRPYHFPRRNRIISGLSIGVVVVEASRKSGALITAKFALEQGRDVMAFPGSPGSEYFSGNNYLIKEGAHLVENASDIMSIMGKLFKSKKKSSKLAYSPLETDILQVIGDDEVSLEDIGSQLGGPQSRIAAALMMLELKGIVMQQPGKIFTRAG